MTERIKKIRGNRLKSVFERFGLCNSLLTSDLPSSSGFGKTSIMISDSEISGFVAGGYNGKGHLTKTKANDIVQILKDKFDIDIRLEYLLGTDIYMTDADYLESKKKIKKILNRTVRKHLEDSLKEKGMFLADFDRVIFDNGLFPVCQLSISDLEAFESELKQCIDMLTDKYILKEAL